MKQKKDELKKRVRAAMRDERIRRTVILAGILLLLTITTVIALTVAANRAKKAGVDRDLPTISEKEGEVTEEKKTDPKPDSGKEKEEDVKKEGETPAVLEVIPEMALPVSGYLAKGYSADLQVFSITMGDYRVHLGIDLGTEEGAPVCAAAAGTVGRVWEDPMMGWSVLLNHAGDCQTVYQNLSPALAEGITEGASVRQGQLLGSIGDTAMAEIGDEAHLHLEMKVGGVNVNPVDYYSEAVRSTLGQDFFYESDDGGKG